jgi:hypothetical protein
MCPIIESGQGKLSSDYGKPGVGFIRCFGTWRRAVWETGPNISEKLDASIFRVGHESHAQIQQSTSTVWLVTGHSPSWNLKPHILVLILYGEATMSYARGFEPFQMKKEKLLGSLTLLLTSRVQSTIPNSHPEDWDRNLTRNIAAYLPKHMPWHSRNTAAFLNIRDSERAWKYLQIVSRPVSYYTLI